MIAQLDPLKKYNPVLDSQLIEGLGILPLWLAQGKQLGEDAKTALTRRYQFYTGCDIEGGRIDAEGVYRYPGDPPLYPVMKVSDEKETVYFYPYAIVAVVNEEGTWITRMD